MLGKKSDLRLQRRIVEFQAENPGRTCGREDHAHQKLERSSLARAVGTEIAKHFSGIDREVQRVQRALWPLAPEPHLIALFKTQNFNSCHCSVCIPGLLLELV